MQPLNIKSILTASLEAADTQNNDEEAAAAAAEAEAAAAGGAADEGDQGAGAGDAGNADAGAQDGAAAEPAGEPAAAAAEPVQTASQAAAEAGADNLGAAAGGDVAAVGDGTVDAAGAEDGAATLAGAAGEGQVQIDPPTPVEGQTKNPDIVSNVPEIGEVAAAAANAGSDSTGAPQAGMAAEPAPASGDLALGQGEGEPGAAASADETQQDQLLGDDQQLAIIPAETERLLSDTIAESTELDQSNQQLQDVEGKVGELVETVDEMEEKAAAGELDEASLESFNRRIGSLLGDLKLGGQFQSIGMEDDKPSTGGIRGLIEKIKEFVAGQKKELAERSTKWKANVFTNASQVKKRAQLAQKLVSQAGLVARDGDITVNARKLYVEGASLSDAVKIASTLKEVSSGIASAQDKLTAAYKPALKLWEGLDYSTNAKFEETVKGAKSIPEYPKALSSAGVTDVMKKIGYELEDGSKDVKVVEGASDDVAHIVKVYNSIGEFDSKASAAEKSAKAQAISPDQAKKVVELVLGALDGVLKHDVGLQSSMLLPKEVRDAGPKGAGFLSSLSAANQQGVEKLFYILSDVDYAVWADRVSVAVAVSVAANELLAWVEKSVYVKKGE